jgi:hypothetical protein
MKASENKLKIELEGGQHLAPSSGLKSSCLKASL